MENQQKPTKKYVHNHYQREEFIFGEVTYEESGVTVERKYIDSHIKQTQILYTKVYRRDKESRANFLIIHGLGEHAGRYTGIAKMLAENDMEVHMIDLTGYGASGGGRAMSSFIELQDNIAKLFKQVDEEKPIFLMGHSMGGGLVLNFVLANPQLRLAGLLLNSPFYRFPDNVRMNFFKRRILKFLTGAVPEIVMGAKISINAITKDPKILESYKDEKLFVNFLTLRMVTTLVDITLPLKRRSLILNCPVLLMAGEKDLVCEFKYTEQLYAKLVAPEKKFHTFPEGLHEPHADFEFEEWFQTLNTWVDHKLETFRPEQQCSFSNLKHKPGISAYMDWKRAIIRLFIYGAIFYYFRQRKWKLLKRILNL